jgi:hypothetical protein
MPDPDRTTARRPTPLVDHLLALLAAVAPATAQRRTHTRLVLLTLGHLLALGRQTLTQVLVALGLGAHDWSAWYRLFNRERVRVPVLQRQVVRALVAQLAPGAPLVVALDATQLPRSSWRFPGVGWTRAPRAPHWHPGLHQAQRLEVLSGLLPRSAAGDSRAVPIRATYLRSPQTRPIGAVPLQSEGVAGVRLVRWLRLLLTLALPGEQDRPMLVLADGAYSTAPVIRRLPRGCWLLARGAKNRALWAVPAQDPHHRGRRRIYGERGPTPQQTLHQRTGWQTTTVVVRGRPIPLTATVTGPWLVQRAGGHPLMLIVVKGIDHAIARHRRRRDPQFFLCSAVEASPGQWVLPLPLTELLGWAWQRWEVEVMHRELKSGFGLGDQQAWSASGALGSTAWVLWTYALVILAAYAVWGLGPAPGPDLGRWYRPRRWAIGRVRQEVRAELWHLAELQPRWQALPDPWAEMETWITTQPTAVLGQRPG